MASKREERKRLAELPAELGYWPKVHVPEGVAEKAAVKVLFIGLLIAVLVAVAGAQVLAGFVVLVTAVATLGTWKKRNIPRSYARLSVRKGVLEIRTGWQQGQARAVEDPSPRLVTNVADILDVILDDHPTSEVPLARICIVEKDRTTPLTDNYAPRHDGKAFLANMRSFLRSQEWVPAKRSEPEGETDAS